MSRISTKKPNRIQRIRNLEYYNNMQDIQDDLYSKAKNNAIFTNLLPLITHEENIMLAFRTLKTTHGCIIHGIDGKTIEYVKSMNKDHLVDLVRTTLLNYQPKALRKVNISRESSFNVGKNKTLGIPTIIDRLIHLCIKQILEPICEAYFYNYSYGFRPFKRRKGAIARFYVLANKAHMRHVISINLTELYSHIDSSKILKQLWSIGIRDKRILSLLRKIMDCSFKGEIHPGGIIHGSSLAPLLMNIYLNEFDWWISSQWNTHKTHHQYKKHYSIYDALRKTNLKPCFLVRHMDQIRILCQSYNNVKRLMYAIKDWFITRLNLSLNDDCINYTNLMRQYCTFLGYKIKVVKKSNKWVVNSYVSDEELENIVINIRNLVKEIQHTGKYGVLKYNSYVLGVHKYFQYATHCSIGMLEVLTRTRSMIHNRLNPRRFIYGKDKIPKYLENSIYLKSDQLRMVCGLPLLPIAFLKTTNAYCDANLSMYVKEDREKIHKMLNLDQHKFHILSHLMNSTLSNTSIEYHDNRISKYTDQCGKCYVSDTFLQIGSMECHHKIPKKYGGNDSFDNLVWLTDEIHRLVHSTSKSTIDSTLQSLKLTSSQIEKLNDLRKKVGLGRL